MNELRKRSYKFPRQTVGTKTCSKCRLTQDVGCFYSDKNNRDGLKSQCKYCENQDRKTKRDTDLVGRLLSSAKGAAKFRGDVFSLKREDIIIPDLCPILNIPLYFDNDRGANTPSIDRIRSDIGYIKGNIIVCSWRINHIKGDATISDMEMVYRNWHYQLQHNELILPNHQFYLKRMIIHCKERCNLKKIDFNLTTNDIKIPLLCPVLGLQIRPGKRIFADTSPSLDRIDIDHGYTPENIRITSWKANKLKNNATYSEYERMYHFYRNLNG